MPLEPGSTEAFLRGWQVEAVGGLGEMGRHHLLVDVPLGSFAIDCGSIFPDPAESGIDRRLPSLLPALRRREEGRLRGVLLTHAHLDHIGSLGALLEWIPELPVWGTGWTLAVLRRVLAGQSRWSALRPDLREVDPGQWTDIEGVGVCWAHMTHSIPGACSLALEGPDGLIVHSGDFRVDETPLVGGRSDLATLERWGDLGVAVALVDSTNAARPGRSLSESTVHGNLRERIRHADGRVFVTMFGSHLERVVGLARAAAELGRRVAVLGRSLEGTIDLAAARGLWPTELARPVLAHDVPPGDRAWVIAVTGSQGEARSPLARMARGEERALPAAPGDLVLWSARAIPGNERSIGRVVNALIDQGVDVVPPWVGAALLHTSGHGHGEEVLDWVRCVRPAVMVPIHGESWHLHSHGERLRAAGVDAHRVVELRNGDLLRAQHGRVLRFQGKAGVDEVLLGDQRWQGDEPALQERTGLREGGAAVVFVDGPAPGGLAVVTLGALAHADRARVEGAVTADLAAWLGAVTSPRGDEEIGRKVRSLLQKVTGLRLAVRVLRRDVVKNAESDATHSDS